MRLIAEVHAFGKKINVEIRFVPIILKQNVKLGARLADGTLAVTIILQSAQTSKLKQIVITSTQNTIVLGRVLFVPTSQNVQTTSLEQLVVHQNPAQLKDVEAISEIQHVKTTFPLSSLVLLSKLLAHAIIQALDLAFGILLAKS